MIGEKKALAVLPGGVLLPSITSLEWLRQIGDSLPINQGFARERALSIYTPTFAVAKKTFVKTIVQQKHVSPVRTPMQDVPGAVTGLNKVLLRQNILLSPTVR